MIFGRYATWRSRLGVSYVVRQSYIQKYAIPYYHAHNGDASTNRQEQNLETSKASNRYETQRMIHHLFVLHATATTMSNLSPPGSLKQIV
jgi:hypothetical protein